MASNNVPTSVPDLLARAAVSAANIRQHREAMAEVAAQAKANNQPKPQGEGETK